MINKRETPALLSTAYFGPTGYYSKLLLYNEVFIEQYENFTKQTYRNRCEIMGANGLIPLVVPVVKGRGPKILIRDILISYDTQWQRNHWRTIFSAYNSSPYFTYYKDDLRDYFNNRWKYLLDFNMAINERICELAGIDADIKLTSGFENVPEGTVNLRDFFTPKKHKGITDISFSAKEYTQVFSDKFGFVSNLSILDLLFNEGPNSFNRLSSSTVSLQNH